MKFINFICVLFLFSCLEFKTPEGIKDSDGDGLIDSDELRIGSNPNSKDTDGDGKLDKDEAGDDLDKLPDLDGDNVADILESSIEDKDGDGAFDDMDGPGPDGDLDGDGLINSIEDQIGTDKDKKDSDGDGIDDPTEVGTDVLNAPDSDGDGVIDAAESNLLDDDEDGVPDQLDGPGENGDQDGDGVDNKDDNCPKLSNQNQLDIDEDSLGDLCDDDMDGDGIDNIVEEALQLNPGSADSDSDGIDDMTEIGSSIYLPNDSDGDGIIDARESSILDTDGDGANDQIDGPGLNGDQDGDGLTNAIENNLNTDSNKKDTDGDGFNDFDEVGDSANPLDFDMDSIIDALESSILDSDGDGANDQIDGPAPDADLDGDTVINSLDNCVSEPNFNQLDLDSDSIGDKCDDDIDNDGLSNELEEYTLLLNPYNNDTDLDGILDGVEVGENVYSPLDIDEDGFIDAKESAILDDDHDGSNDQFDGPGENGESDGDGILNKNDNCPNDKNVEQTNTDGDEFGDICDSDDDNDGMPDLEDRCSLIYIDGGIHIDTDGDTEGDECDQDIDDDGLNNDDELILGTDPYDADTDDDGIDDYDDNCKLIPNSLLLNNDNDEYGDACDDDDDNDGVLDDDDNCDFEENPDQLNFDGDQLGDSCDSDDDNDTRPEDGDNSDIEGDAPCTGGNVVTCDDNCPRIINMNQNDMDSDGIGDVCDTDIDGDGIKQDYDDSGNPNENPCIGGIFENCDDNCPLAVNPGQEDADNDGIGDLCDGDLDTDGVADDIDNCPDLYNPDQDDTNNDGEGDQCDDDIDGDGKYNHNDNCIYVINADQADFDEDGEGDSCDTDDDNDGSLDIDDNCHYVANIDQVNSDGDTLGDACDNCPTVTNENQNDTNEDGTGDACEDDSDGDSILDDGNNSGVVGDYYCTGGMTENCDDNCQYEVNPNQADIDGNGVGNVCDCGSSGDIKWSYTLNSVTENIVNNSFWGSEVISENNVKIHGIDSVTGVKQGSYIFSQLHDYDRDSFIYIQGDLEVGVTLLFSNPLAEQIVYKIHFSHCYGFKPVTCDAWWELYFKNTNNDDLWKIMITEENNYSSINVALSSDGRYFLDFKYYNQKFYDSDGTVLWDGSTINVGLSPRVIELSDGKIFSTGNFDWTVPNEHEGIGVRIYNTDGTISFEQEDSNFNGDIHVDGNDIIYTDEGSYDTSLNVNWNGPICEISSWTSEGKIICHTENLIVLRDPSDGSFIWTLEIQDNSVPTPTINSVEAFNGIIYALSTSGFLHAIDPNDGNPVELWQEHVGGSSMPLIAENYLVYLHSGGQLKAICQ